MRLSKYPSALTADIALPPLLLYFALSLFYLGALTQAFADSLAELSDPDTPLSSNALKVSSAPREIEPRHEDLVGRYEPEFIGVSRGIIGRAGDDTKTLDNNQPGKPQNGLQSGQTQYYTFPKSALLGPKSPSTPGLPSTIARRDEDGQEQGTSDELKKRQSGPQLFITLNTCSQPLPNSGTGGAAGQLQLFVSTSSSNQKPSESNSNYAVSVDGGYGSQNIPASDDVFFSVSAPSNNGFTGNYEYELTASIDDYYTMYQNLNYSRVADTDTHNVLLYTNDLTSTNSSTAVFQEWLNTRAFSVYIYSQQNPQILGIQKSLCALSAHNQRYLSPQSNDTSMTTAIDGQPKQQFFAKNLNGSSSYNATIVIEGNSTNSGGGVVNGGGTVWPSVNFTTKADNNCAIIYNLTFCSDVGYAVPWNPSNSNSSLQDTQALGLAYDQNASDTYVFFNKSLQQVPCNTTSSAQYSLARNCTDCANAYKQWLCAVIIPRCEDFSNNAPYLRPRAVAQSFINTALETTSPTGNGTALSACNKTVPYMNTSRNPFIDASIHPGPYKEVLPCQDLCYNLVRSCPAMLQFACPLPGYGLEISYGKWNPNSPPGQYSCNLMGLKMSHGVQLTYPVILGTVMTTIAILATSLA